jgi:hypothetical protein
VVWIPFLTVSCFIAAPPVPPQAERTVVNTTAINIIAGFKSIIFVAYIFDFGLLH